MEERPIIFVSFIHFGDNKCPKCGLIGDVIKGEGRNKHEDARHEFDYLRCPGCETEFTHEMILDIGDKEFDFRPN